MTLTLLPLNLDQDIPRPETSDANLARIAARTLEMISKYGRPYALVRKAKGTPSDSTEPWRSDTGTEVRTHVLAVSEDFDQAEVDNTTIMSGDKKLYIAAESLTEAERSVVEDHNLAIDDDQTWRIRGVDTIRVGITTILYTFHLSKSGR